MNREPLTLILAEDDDGHAHLIEKNLARAGFCNPLIRCRDGQETLDLLRGDSCPVGSMLMIVDVKMPKVDGIELLRQLKTDPRLAKIPVIILTTTDDPREIERCYELGCNVYITKPVAYETFIEAIHRLGLFLEVVQCPKSMIQVSASQ